MQKSMVVSQESPEFAIGLLSFFVAILFLALTHLIGMMAAQGTIGLQMLQFLPLVFVLLAAGFIVPICGNLNTGRCHLVWLVVPAVVLLTSAGLAFTLNSANAWNTWQFRWPLAPMGLSLSMYMVYLMGQRQRWLLLISTTIMGASLLVFSFLAAFIGEWIYTQPQVPMLLCGCGVLLVSLNLIQGKLWS